MRKLSVIIGIIILSVISIDESKGNYLWVEKFEIQPGRIYTTYEDYYNSRLWGSVITFYEMISGSGTSKVMTYELDCDELSLVETAWEKYSKEMGKGTIIDHRRLSESRIPGWDEKVYITPKYPASYKDFTEICNLVMNEGIDAIREKHRLKSINKK
jgi:hypothetical protein